MLQHSPSIAKEKGPGAIFVNNVLPAKPQISPEEILSQTDKEQLKNSEQVTYRILDARREGGKPVRLKIFDLSTEALGSTEKWAQVMFSVGLVPFEIENCSTVLSDGTLHDLRDGTYQCTHGGLLYIETVSYTHLTLPTTPYV